MWYADGTPINRCARDTRASPDAGAARYEKQTTESWVRMLRCPQPVAALVPEDPFTSAPALTQLGRPTASVNRMPAHAAMAHRPLVFSASAYLKVPDRCQ